MNALIFVLLKILKQTVLSFKIYCSSSLFNVKKTQKVDWDNLPAPASLLSVSVDKSSLNRFLKTFNTNRQQTRESDVTSKQNSIN